MRPETEILICCARTRMDDETADRLRSLLQQGCDWQCFVESALCHGLAPLVYHHLRRIGPDTIPKEIHDRFEQLYLGNEERNLFLTGELIRLMSRLETQGIAAVPLKGPALASSIYGELAFRQFNDLDILIQKRDVPRAVNLMIDLGYRPEFTLSGARQTAYIKSQCDLLFTRKDRRLLVEIAWDIVPAYFGPPLVSDDLWKRLAEDKSENLLMPPFLPEDLLLILCVHGAKHLWNRLTWLCDVAETVRHYHGELDWDRALERANNLGYLRMLLLGLFLARDMLGTSLPEKILQPLESDATVRKIGEEIRRQLRTKTVPGTYSSCKMHAFLLRTKERLIDKIRYGLRLATTPSPEDWSWISFPDPLYSLYSVIRPVRLTGKHVRRFVWKTFR